MNITAASRKCGVPVKTIQHFELMGFISPTRIEDGDQLYSECDTEKLKFLKMAHGAGFSTEECRNLLRLYFHERRNPNEKNIREQSDRKPTDCPA